MINSKMHERIRYSRYFPLFLLILIFIFGIILRIYRLGAEPPGLYTDELNGLITAKIQMYGTNSVPFHNISSVIFSKFLYDSVNGYFLSIFVFGFSNMAARFPYALYSALIVFPLYGFSSELFGDKRVGLLSSALWIVSPASFVTARVGNSAEIFPLFIFFVFLYLIIMLFRTRKVLIYIPILIVVTGFSLYVPSISAWAMIPILVTVLSLVGYFLLSKSNGGKLLKVLFYAYFAFIVFGILVVVFYSNILFTTVLKPLSASQVTSSFFLFHEPFNQSVLAFLLRFLVYLSPQKLFLISHPLDPTINVHTVLVPLMPFFLLFAFYPSLLYIAISIVLNKHRHSYIFIIILFLAGFIQPILNVSNPITYLEPAEALFALPFAIIISSIIIIKIVIYTKDIDKSQIGLTLFPHEICRCLTKFVKNHAKSIRASLIVILIVFIGLGTVTSGIFIHTYFTEYEHSLEDNSTSVFYPVYGIQQSSSYLVDHNLTQKQIFFVPSNGGGINFSSINIFNYWVYSLHFPSEWFYLYSHGKISSLDVLHPGELPNPDSVSAVIVSQNASYGQFLENNGFSTKILYIINRLDGIPAVIIYKISPEPNILSQLTKHIDFNETLTNGTLAFNRFSLPLNTSFSATLSFLATGNVSTAHEVSLFASHGEGFTLGIGPASFFPWLNLPNSDIVPFGNLYSYIKSGNYSVPNSWWQFAAKSVISPDSRYLLTITYNDGEFSFYLNSTLIGNHIIDYPVHITGITLFSPKNITSFEATIFNTTLNYREIYSLWVTTK